MDDTQGGDATSPDRPGHRLDRLVVLAMASGALVVLVAVAVSIASSDGDASGATGEVDPQAAAQRAGCRLARHREEGAEHTADPVRYATNPPTSGPHAPEPSPDGLFEPGREPAPEQLVHALEHGRVIIQYRPGTPPDERAALEALFEEPVKGSPAYHTILMQNNTAMRPALAATSWTRSITCARADTASIDAVRAFRERYVDQAPELVP